MQDAQRYLGAVVTGAFLLLAGATAVTATAAPGGGHGGGGHGGGHGGGAHGSVHGGSAHPAAPGAARPGNGIGAGTGNGYGRGNSGLGAGASGNGNGGVGNGNGNDKSSTASTSSAKVQASSAGTSNIGGASTSAQSTPSNPDGGGPPERISIAAPRVTVGDGRNGLTQAPKSVVAVSIPSAPDRFTAAAPAGTATISIQAQSNSGRPAEDRMLARIGRGMLPLWAGRPRTDMHSLWFGLTGLVLMPLAGLWLGYRQARAERDIGRLRD